MLLQTPDQMLKGVEELANNKHCADLDAALQARLFRLTPPESILTVDCSEKYRIMPASEGDGTVRYDRWRTPYNVGPMNSLDNPDCNLVVMVKPSRSGGTTVAENYAFKMMLIGPMGHISFILETDDAVKKYVENVVKPMFDNNPDLAARIDPRSNTDTYKRVSGKPVEWLAAKDGTFRNREPIFMALTETDGWKPKFAASPKVQVEGRQKQLGRRKKAVIESHPDKGYGSGVAAAYESTSRGIYIMRCAECGHHAAAHSTKHWPGVPQFSLYYEKLGMEHSQDERLDAAARTAAMLCPHCGALIDDETRWAMVDDALRSGEPWMHRGQTLDPVHGIQGEPDPNPEHGYWIHGLMLKSARLSELAKGLEEAICRYERTKDPSLLREFMSKGLGEVYDGQAALGGLTAETLKERVKESQLVRSVAPAEVRFITAAVDTGARKFDIGFWGWDLEGRSWMLDRVTIRQRRHSDGVVRELSLAERIEDWELLYEHVADRRFEIEGRPGWFLPVAAAAIDTGDGKVTWKAREFARRALAKRYYWGTSAKPWSRFKLIKGASRATAPMIPNAPRKVDKDELGKPVSEVMEYELGVHRLKERSLERLAIRDDSPGACYFSAGIEARYIDEFFGEKLIDGKWIRSGPNESFDLFGYGEAVRQMLAPDRSSINWDAEPEKLPVWARPIGIETGKGGDPEVAAEGKSQPAPPRKSVLERFDELNR